VRQIAYRRVQGLPRFTAQQVVVAFEIEHFVTEYWYEIDVNGGKNVQDFWFDDGHFTAGTAVDLHGATSIVEFYEERRELVAKGPGGVRTSRHVSTNTRYTFEGLDEVSLSTTIVNFSGAGRPPLAGSSPTIVGDGYMLVRRDANGKWRLKRFKAEMIFIGSDPFQNLRLMGSSEPV
jgi:hypothetical protein